jgi:hypothetical protein
MQKTVEQLLATPTRFKSALDLIFSINPQKTRKRAKVWREAAYLDEFLGEVTPTPRAGKINYKISDALGEDVTEVAKFSDVFQIMRQLDE